LRPVPVGSVPDLHLCPIVTLQSGEALHMGVNATTFAYRQMTQASRTGGPDGMLAAAARCYRARNTGAETPYRSSVLTVPD